MSICMLAESSVYEVQPEWRICFGRNTPSGDLVRCGLQLSSTFLIGLRELLEPRASDLTLVVSRRDRQAASPLWSIHALWGLCGAESEIQMH